MRRLISEPLVHFLIIGAACFALFGYASNSEDDDGNTIVVTETDINRLNQLWERTRQRPPTDTELNGLIEDFIREEILYREAVALDLDHNDTIVRRRMRQKLEFLTEDLASARPPSTEDLEAFMASRPESYSAQPRVSFQHVYVSEEMRGREASEQASRWLQALTKGEVAVSEIGDRLPLPSSFDSTPIDRIGTLFGRGFADQLAELTEGGWQGPIQSAFGLHLVRITATEPARMPTLDEVRGAVERDWLAEKRTAAKEAFYQNLKEKYQIEIRRPVAGAVEAES